MAHTIIRYSQADLTALPAARREDHRRFLRDYRDALVAFGPLARRGAPCGYLYQIDLPDRAAAARFLGEDPLFEAGLYHATITSEWHCALPYRLPLMPPRPGLAGFFFHGIGKPDMTRRRDAIVAAHRAHLQPKDTTNCLSRGYLSDFAGRLWMGSAMVYEFRDRAEFDAFFRDEPYSLNGLYQRVDIYDWRRGSLA